MTERSEFPLMANRPIQNRVLSPFRELHAQGVQLLQVDATFSEDLFHPDLRAWKAPGIFDYSYQESYWKSLLSACPGAKLCLRLSAASPPWWDEHHPEELQRYSDGSTEAEFQRTKRRTLPSLASTVWRSDAMDALTRFLRWLETSGWSEHIWGIFLAYGITWEWGILGTDRFPDYSEPMRARFREWLKSAYGEASALQRQWGDPSVDFEPAEIPSEEARRAGTGGLRVFPRDRAAADFQNCLSDTNCDLLLALGRAVRAQSGHRYKLGTFYGYTLTAREHTAFTSQYGAGGLAGGHHAFGKFLRSGVFDFNASPYAYANRELGQGCLLQHFPRASCQTHGVHVYDENDLRTFLVAGLSDDRTISIGQTHSLEASIQHQRWAAAQAICHDTSYWWTELSGWIGPYQPNFDHPRLLAELREHRALFEQCRDRRKARRAEIAIIIDERAIASLSLDSQLFKNEVYAQLAAWHWCGAPVDFWLADDVAPATMKQVRLAYVFSPSPTEGLRHTIRTALCGDQRTVWWAPWTGALTDAGIDPTVFAALTGHEDPGNVGTLRRADFGTWISLYGPCAGMTPQTLADVARTAGVRMIGEAPLHAMQGEHFLALQSADDRDITLPGSWRNVWTGEKLSAGAVSLKATETLLLEDLTD